MNDALKKKLNLVLREQRVWIFMNFPATETFFREIYFGEFRVSKVPSKNGNFQLLSRKFCGYENY